MPLFRPESLRSQDRLHGDVDLAPPVSWQLIGTGIAIVLAVACTFLGIARYSRVAQATGVVESDRGVVPVVADRRGTATRVLVRDGQRVRRGDPLVVIDHSSQTAGGSLQDLRAAAARDEASALALRAPALRRAAEARIEADRNDIATAQSDQHQLAAQIAEQAALVASAREDLDRAREVAANGFVSKTDVRRREETLASRIQERSRLDQQLATARGTASTASRRIAQERADLDSTLGDLAGQRASLQARAAADDNVGVTIVRAAADGVVADVTVVVGEPLTDGQQAMTLVPAGGTLRVRLSLPADATAVVAPGQVANVAIDAFPYQTYGTLPARLTRVSETAIAQGNSRGFVAYASLPRASVSAYGVERPVKTGMTVTARIKTMDRTLAQWLLDPLYAVATR